MLWRDTVKLINITYGENGAGDTIETPVKSEPIFVNKKSIRSTEFYQAAQTDFKPELMFEMKVIDYGGQSSLEFNEKDYNIIRTYDKNGEIIELICQGLV